MKKPERNIFVINPLDKGYTIDFYDGDTPQKVAKNSTKNAFDFVRLHIKADHQIVIIDKGDTAASNTEAKKGLRELLDMLEKE